MSRDNGDFSAWRKATIVAYLELFCGSTCITASPPVTFDTCLPHRALHKGTKSSHKPSREGAADVAALLQETQSALEQLQSEVFAYVALDACGVIEPSNKHRM